MGNEGSAEAQKAAGYGFQAGMREGKGPGGGGGSKWDFRLDDFDF